MFASTELDVELEPNGHRVGVFVAVVAVMSEA